MSETASCHAAGGGRLPTTFNGASGRRHYVALAGPPNAGKTTLFNRLTGLRQKVANFPGVTVEYHAGKARTGAGRDIYLIDLPGIYSMEPRSDDERVTRDVLIGAKEELGRPDAIVLILDVTNLSRHLLLAAPILQLGLPTLIALNMADDLEARGGSVDPAALSKQLGCAVALISAASGQGVEKVVQFLEGTVARPLQQAPRVELPILQDLPSCRRWAGNASQMSGYQAPAPPIWTRRLDAVFLHPTVGPLIFLAVVMAVFQSIFSGARPIMDAVEHAVATSGNWIAQMLPEGILRSVVIEGVWGGVGSVLIFLPQILLLFLFIGVLEDSGYLARAALIADRTMARVGLQGKAFIPLLSAYACAVPAIMATRTIENKRDRLATILIAPFMTCSARLPIYVLIIAAFLPDRPLIGNLFGTQAAAMMALYLIGFLAAFATAQLLRASVLRHQRSTFVMELPPYRLPNFRSLGLRLYDRAMAFLKRAGTVILVVSLALWLLAHLPYKDGQPAPLEQSYAGQLGHAMEPAIKPLGFNWKIGIGLITSLFAREVIIGTLGTIYGIENAKEDNPSLQEAIHRDLTPAGAAALLVFFAFAMQCFSTIAVVRRETGSWTWPAAQFLYMSCFAFFSAWATHAVLQHWYF